MQKKQILLQQIDVINHKNMKELHDKFRELYGFECDGTSPRRGGFACRNITTTAASPAVTVFQDF